MRTGSPIPGPVIGGPRYAVLNNAAIPAFRTQVRLACGSADCALTRRGKMGIEPSTLTAGDLSLDRSSFELASIGGSTPLANKEFQIMELLMRNRGGYLSIDRLIELVWGFGSAAEPNVVWAHISNLRRKIESVGSKARIVASGQGGQEGAPSELAPWIAGTRTQISRLDALVRDMVELSRADESHAPSTLRISGSPPCRSLPASGAWQRSQ